VLALVDKLISSLFHRLVVTIAVRGMGSCSELGWGDSVKLGRGIPAPLVPTP